MLKSNGVVMKQDKQVPSFSSQYNGDKTPISEKNKKKIKKMKKLKSLHEVKLMQKLAGIISEGDYKRFLAENVDDIHKFRHDITDIGHDMMDVNQLQEDDLDENELDELGGEPTGDFDDPNTMHTIKLNKATELSPGEAEDVQRMLAALEKRGWKPDPKFSVEWDVAPPKRDGNEGLNELDKDGKPLPIKKMTSAQPLPIKKMTSAQKARKDVLANIQKGKQKSFDRQYNNQKPGEHDDPRK